MPFSGQRLRETRESRKITQRKLAELSGIDDAQLSRYEHGKVEPSLKYLESFAKLLDVSTDYLIGLTDYPQQISGDAELGDTERAMVEIYRREGWTGVIRLGAERLAK